MQWRRSLHDYKRKFTSIVAETGTGFCILFSRLEPPLPYSLDSLI